MIVLYCMCRVGLVRMARVLLVGDSKETMLLSSALLQRLEHCTVVSIGLETLYGDPARSPEEAVTKVTPLSTTHLISNSFHLDTIICT
jgi:hypothetical protein